MLGSLGAIGVASAGAGLGTTAYFSDEESFDDNSLTAGKLNLVVDYYRTVDQGSSTSSTSGEINNSTCSFEIGDVKPGDSGSFRFCPKVIDNPGWLWIGSDGLTDYEKGTTDPESEVDTTGGHPGKGNGELSEAIQVTVSYCDDSGNNRRELNNPADYTLADLFKELESGFLLDGDAGGQSGTQPYPASEDSDSQTGPCLCIEWELPSHVGNEVQTDSVEFTIAFAALQKRHNDTPQNPFADATVAPGGSIQSAIDGASAGDTISVFGGTFGNGSSYDEALSVDKSLTLARASAEMPVIEDTSGDNIETVSISSSDVVFDGFEVTGSESGQQNAGIRVEAPSDSALSNIQVCNCVIRDIVAEARATGIGIDADQGPIPKPGADGTIEGVEVYNCRIEDISNTAPLSPSPYNDSRAKGIAMNGRVFDPTVRHVTVQNVGDPDYTTFGRAVTITEDPNPSPPVGAQNFDIRLSEFSGMQGTFKSDGTNYGGAAMFIGQYPDFGDHVVENNNIEDLVENFPDGTPPQPSTDELNAPNNWWGASDGPSGAGSGSGVVVTRNVDFNPVRSSPVSDAGATV